MKRLAKPTEVGELFAFLGSDESSYLTGSQIVIDGGSTLPETMSIGYQLSFSQPPIKNTPGFLFPGVFLFCVKTETAAVKLRFQPCWACRRRQFHRSDRCLPL